MIGFELCWHLYALNQNSKIAMLKTFAFSIFSEIWNQKLVIVVHIVKFENRMTVISLTLSVYLKKKFRTKGDGFKDTVST
jgi:hypothetical protein